MTATLFEMEPAARSRRKLFSLRRDKEGWWFYTEPIWPDVPWSGPWPTKGDAREAVRSYKRNNINAQRPCDIKSEWNRRRK